MGDYPERVLVTGGAGFIGSHCVDLMLASGFEVLNIDCLNYAANLDYLAILSKKPRYSFKEVDIRDSLGISRVLSEFQPNHIINFAAESHVDNSIIDPEKTIDVNLNGARTLYQCANNFFKSSSISKRNTFIQISTDEVYGARLPNEFADETAQLNASNIYSASKAAADILGLAYHSTFNFPIIITRCCNNYGLRQNIEKFIPTIIDKLKSGNKIPVFGSGDQIRQWLHVKDHVSAVLQVMKHGRFGQVYNIGDENYISNINLIKKIIPHALSLKSEFAVEQFINQIPDRLGHDFSYSITSKLIRKELAWLPKIDFDEGLKELVTNS